MKGSWRNWDLAPCGRTEVPKESPSKATGEKVFHLQWGLKTVLWVSKNTKALASSKGLRKYIKVRGYKSLSSEGIGKYFKACKWRFWRHRKWFKVTKILHISPPYPMLLLYKYFKGLGNLYLIVHADHSHGRALRLFTSILPKGNTCPYWNLNWCLKHLSPVLALSMTKLEIIVEGCQRLMKDVLIGPVRDMIHKSVLPFVQKKQSFIF